MYFRMSGALGIALIGGASSLSSGQRGDPVRRVKRNLSRSARHREVGGVAAGAGPVSGHRRILLSCEKALRHPYTVSTTGREGAREYPGTAGLVNDAGRRGVRDGAGVLGLRASAMRPDSLGPSEGRRRLRWALALAASRGLDPGDASQRRGPSRRAGRSRPGAARRRRGGTTAHSMPPRGWSPLGGSRFHIAPCESNCGANGMRNVSR